jgi:putative addiction module killer protein
MNVLQTSEFAEWLANLRDVVAKRQIVARLVKLQATGHLGDTKAVGDSLHEMRIHVGPGYRLYYTYLNDGTLILRGGTKNDQRRDIAKAKEILNDP